MRTVNRKTSILLIMIILLLAACLNVGLTQRVAVFAQAAVTRDAAAVYDISDITGTTEMHPAGISQHIGAFPNGETVNAAMKMKIVLPETEQKSLAFSFLTSEGNGGWLGPDSVNRRSRGGYKFYMDKDTVKLQYYRGTWPPAVGASAATKATMKAGQTFTLEVGALKQYEDGVWAGNYVYAKVDGEEFISFVDTTDTFYTGVTPQIPISYKDGGSHIYIDPEFPEPLGAYTEYLQSVTFATTKYIPTPDREDATVYDLRDVSTYYTVEFSGIDQIYIGNLKSNVNAAFSARVDMPITSAIDRINFAILQKQNTLWPHIGGGYLLTVTASEVFFEYSPDYGTVSEPCIKKLPGSLVAFPDAMKPGSSYVMEIGAVDYYEDGVHVGTYVYLNVDGVEITHGIDRNLANADKGVMIIGPISYGNGPFSISSSQKEPDYELEEAKVYDLYDIAHSRSAYVSMNKEPRCVGETDQTDNIAYTCRITMPDNKTVGTPRIAILQSQSNSVWSFDRSGYLLTVQTTGIVIFNRWSTVLVQKATPAYMGPGKTFTIEFGAVACKADGKDAGDYVYLKVNGTELMHAVDASAPPKGKYVVVANYDSEQDNFLMESNYTFHEIAQENANAHVTVADGIYAKDGEDAQVSIACEEGYAIKRALVNGVDATDRLLEQPGGYLLRLIGVKSAQKLMFETEYREYAVTAAESADARITVDKTTVKHGGTLTFSALANRGKALKSLSLNGADVTRDVAIRNGKYIYTAYAVKGSVVFTAEFETKKFNVVTSVPGGGGTAEAGESQVEAGGKAVITLRAQDGKYIECVKVNGQLFSPASDGTVTIEGVYSDLHVEVLFSGVAQVAPTKNHTGLILGLILGLGIPVLAGAAVLAIVLKRKGRK